MINGTYYIGCHTTRNMNNKYLGSGVYLKRSIAKYGIENFKKEILFFCKDREEKFDSEKQLVNEVLVQDPLCMNLAPGGKGGCFPGERASFSGNKHKPETIEVMKEKAKHRPPPTLETREKIKKNHADVSGEKNPMYGKISAMAGRKRPEVAERNRLKKGIKRGPDSEETRRKKSEAHKGKPSPMLDKKHSIETIEIIREAAKRSAKRLSRDDKGRFIGLEPKWQI